MQVLDHAETVKKLSQQEALVAELQQYQDTLEASSQAAHKAKVSLSAVTSLSLERLTLDRITGLYCAFGTGLPDSTCKFVTTALPL